MKTVILKLAAIMLIITAGAGFCEKDKEPTLPPETQTGANTFGCYVNGELFVNRKNIVFSFAPPRLSAVYDKKNNFFYIVAYSPPNGDRISIQLNEVEINTPKPISEASLSLRSKNEEIDCRYFGGKEIGEIVITKLDTVNNIVSGQFQFQGKAMCPDFSGDSIVFITNGRFDVKLDYAVY